VKHNIVAFIGGLLFAAGLALSGMTMPSKVVAFLDVTGTWDPSLAFVMVSALSVYAIVFRIATKRPAPVLGGRFGLPTRSDLDARLITGATLFGIGWGLGGVCPGPGVVATVSGSIPIITMVAGMFAGMYLFALFEQANERRKNAALKVGSMASREAA